MTLLNDILKWTETLPEWQRDAARRLLQNETGLSGGDFKELYSLLKTTHGINGTEDLSVVPLAASHIPAAVKPDETIILKTLRELQNVNCISSDQTLKFSEKGLTVVYGGNGSGKSGYARVLKRACRARDQSEPIHPNANDATALNAVPTAKFDIEVSGKDEEMAWSRDSPSPDQLSTIGVFDSKCALSYLTTEQDVAYLPYGLDIVENLANQVLPKLTQMLNDEINAIDIDKQAFDHLLGDTEVGKQIGGLTAYSDPFPITALGTLSEEETKRLAELDIALKEVDPIAKAKELRLSVTRLKAFADKLAKPLAWVSDAAVARLKTLDEAKVTAEGSETKAADALRSGEDLLPGTGDQVWKMLFEAARRYSNEVAYPNNEFPALGDDATCPLCQDTLSPNAGERLSRFDEYVRNDIAKTAKSAREKVDTAKQKIETVYLQVGGDNATLEEIRQLDDALPELLGAFETSLKDRQSGMMAALESHEWSKIPDITENPYPKVRLLAARQLRAARILMRAADETKKRELRTEFAELCARRALSRSLNPVFELLQRMKNKAALEKCRPGLETGSISRKSKELASAAVTKELKRALDWEFQALGIGHIKTKLKERNVKGKVLLQLLLDLPTSHKLDEILSEGEQRAIALGSFLAELALAYHSCGIVFDDPVSSLDHKRRGKLARRLAKEGTRRQVVVFTHEVVFLQQLRDECENLSVRIELSFLESIGSSFGKVSEGLPWIHKSFKERISNLKATCKRFEKLPWPSDPPEELASEMIRQYSFIRATIERVTQDLILNGTVQRFRDYIEVSKLRLVVGLEEEEVTETLRLYQRCHDIVEAHDPSSAKDSPPPTAAELRQDISDLKSLIKRINNRRNPPKPSVSST
jgi:energy-coupling factor transporter ATP-binding protein EcfA2